MKSFLTYICEANSFGSNFEKRITRNIRQWVKKHNLDEKFDVRRYQTISEDDGNRDEDYSDIIIINKDTGKEFFVECKQSIRDNTASIMFELSEDLKLIPVKGIKKKPIDDKLYIKLGTDLYNTDAFQKFLNFLQKNFTTQHSYITPKDLYFNKVEISNYDLNKLISKYNNMVRSGKVNSDCKQFDYNVIRKSTRNMLAVALLWRLHDKENTWDICNLKKIPYYSQLVQKHYQKFKYGDIKYIQLGNNFFVFNKNDNPLGIECSEFPNQINGQFDLKFTPRFGTGSMYFCSRSKITDKLKSIFSFI